MLDLVGSTRINMDQHGSILVLYWYAECIVEMRCATWMLGVLLGVLKGHRSIPEPRPCGCCWKTEKLPWLLTICSLTGATCRLDWLQAPECVERTTALNCFDALPIWIYLTVWLRPFGHFWVLLLLLKSSSRHCVFVYNIYSLFWMMCERLAIVSEGKHQMGLCLQSV